MLELISLLSLTALLFSGAEAATFGDDFNITFGKQNVKITTDSTGDTVTLKLTNRTGNHSA